MLKFTYKIKNSLLTIKFSIIKPEKIKIVAISSLNGHFTDFLKWENN